jgi:hypothetical protein
VTGPSPAVPASAELMEGRTAVGSWLLWGGATLLVGTALLLVRLRIPDEPLVGPGLLFGVYGSLLLVSLTAPVVRGDQRQLPQWIVLLLGLAGFALVAVRSDTEVVAPILSIAVALNLAAAVTEEAFFRRFAYGWALRFGVVVAWALSVGAFTLIHLPAYGTGSLWVNSGAAVLLTWQRWASGSWLVPAATHVVANQLAVFGGPLGGSP